MFEIKIFIFSHPEIHVLLKRRFRHTLKKHYYGKVFECHCGSVFVENYRLIAHQRVHSSQMIQCEACPKTFKTKTNYKLHWTVHHSKTHGSLPGNMDARKSESNRKFAKH